MKIFSSNTRPVLIEMTSQNSDGSGYLYEGYEKAEGYNSSNSSGEDETPDFLTEDNTGPTEPAEELIKTYPPPEDADDYFSSLSSVYNSSTINSTPTQGRAPTFLKSSNSSMNLMSGTYGGTEFPSHYDHNEERENEEPTEAPSKSLMIFKRGDDLRQDYVVQTMFFIFNRIWALSPMRYKPFIQEYKYVFFFLFFFLE